MRQLCARHLSRGCLDRLLESRLGQGVPMDGCEKLREGCTEQHHADLPDRPHPPPQSLLAGRREAVASRLDGDEGRLVGCLHGIQVKPASPYSQINDKHACSAPARHVYTERKRWTAILTLSRLCVDEEPRASESDENRESERGVMPGGHRWSALSPPPSYHPPICSCPPPSPAPAPQCSWRCGCELQTARERPDPRPTPNDLRTEAAFQNSRVQV